MSLDLPLVLTKSRLLDTVASSAPRLFKMLPKPETPAIRTKSFHLSCLDQNIVRVYIQTLCIFPVCWREYSKCLVGADRGASSLIRTMPKLPYTPSAVVFASLSRSFPFLLARSPWRTVYLGSLLWSIQLKCRMMS